ncbi:MAG: hypothetical protein HUK22_07165, partial [Thermoguttaceae bacterium]|nr:hypothetical protein [Thermoguttaceae bacterium]
GGDDISGDAGDAYAQFDGDVGADGESGLSGAAFLRIFSLRAATTFVTFFGLGGLLGLALNYSPLASTGLGVGAGIVAMFCVVWFLRLLSSFHGDGSIRENSAAGCEGNVYLRIPARRGGFGKVSVVQQGRAMEYDAATDEPEDLPSGVPIVVVKQLSPSLALVAKRAEGISLKK